MREIKNLRSKTGLSQAKFAQRFGIPKRTVENWESGDRECPNYVYELLEHAVATDYFSPRYATTEEETKE